jgi:hypothetical protein
MGRFPLKGKMLNVRDATHKQVMDNAEVGNLLKIMGLQFGKKYKEEVRRKNKLYKIGGLVYWFARVTNLKLECSLSYIY